MALRYKVSKEAESDLIQFLKIVQTQKAQNKDCDLDKYEIWSKLLPPDPLIIKKLEVSESNEVMSIIDLCSDSDDEILEKEIKLKEEDLEEQEEDLELDKTKASISDIAYVVKENLQTKNDLSEITKQHLQNCLSYDLEKLFEVLGHTLNTNDIYNFGNAIQPLYSKALIYNFCHYLLLPEIKKEYSENILKLLDQYSLAFSVTIVEECVVAFQKLSQHEVNVILQYLKKINSNLQSLLARNLIFSIETLNDDYLSMIGVLVNNELEYEALNKFVEMLSNIAEDHTRDKNFGKLLLTVIELLGPKTTHLEQPLKHIIAEHKSVWKSKLEKVFSVSYDDSMMFTQSFRC